MSTHGCTPCPKCRAHCMFCGGCTCPAQTMTPPTAQSTTGRTGNCSACSIDWGRCVRDWPHLDVPHLSAEGQSWMNVPVEADESPLQKWVRATDYEELSAAVAIADGLLTTADETADRLAVAHGENAALKAAIGRIVEQAAEDDGGCLGCGAYDGHDVDCCVESAARLAEVPR